MKLKPAEIKIASFFAVLAFLPILGLAFLANSSSVTTQLDIFEYTHDITTLSQSVQDDIHFKREQASHDLIYGSISLILGFVIVILFFYRAEKLKMK